MTRIYYSTSHVVWTAQLTTRPDITAPWMQPNISSHLQLIKFALNSNSQGFSQNWCQGESFPANAFVTDFLDPEQMCHTAAMCCETSTKYIVRHVRELNSPASDPCVVPWVAALSALDAFGEDLKIIANFHFLFRTIFLLVIVNFIRTAHDIFI